MIILTTTVNLLFQLEIRSFYTEIAFFLFMANVDSLKNHSFKKYRIQKIKYFKKILRTNFICSLFVSI